jgi:hypothetical protein
MNGTSETERVRRSYRKVLGHLAEAQKVLEVIDEMYGTDSDETANLIVKVKEQVRVNRDTLLEMISTYSEAEVTA